MKLTLNNHLQPYSMDSQDMHESQFSLKEGWCCLFALTFSPLFSKKVLLWFLELPWSDNLGLTPYILYSKTLNFQVENNL